MNLVVHIPDDYVSQLTVNGDLARQTLEALAIDAYRAGRLEKPKLKKLLGLETRYQLDGFLKDHGVFEDYTMDDLEQERRDLRNLGF